MGLGIREFERRVKAIYPRWYVLSRSLVAVTDSGIHQFDEPVRVMEHPICKGPGFETDTMVMEIKGVPSLLDLKKLREGHWYRTQNMQKSIFELCKNEAEEKRKIQSTKTSYETKQFLMEHRKQFREVSRRAGLSKGSVRHN